MLTIIVPSQEFFNEETETFFQTNEYTLKLEHSLLSISKWESQYHKPFLSKNKDDVHTPQEMLDYIKCMTLNTNVPSMVYDILTNDNLLEINDYIKNPMTATTIRKMPNSNNQIITSELIYYWMTAFNIPFECEKWHFNRLIMLIRVCNAMTNPPKNSRPDMAARRNLNESRLAAAAKRRG